MANHCVKDDFEKIYHLKEYFIKQMQELMKITIFSFIYFKRLTEYSSSSMFYTVHIKLNFHKYLIEWLEKNEKSSYMFAYK